MTFRIAAGGVLILIAAGTLRTIGAPAVVSAQPPKSSWSGVYSDGQAKRGEALYVENCAACHTPDLTGGELAPPLTGPAFLARWNNKALGELFDYMRSAMPLNSPGGLDPQQNADILAFMLRKASYPVGQMDLPFQGGALNEIKLLATKP